VGRFSGTLVAAILLLSACPHRSLYRHWHQRLAASPYEVGLLFSVLGSYHVVISLAPEPGLGCEEYRLITGRGSLRASLPEGREHVVTFEVPAGGLDARYSGDPHVRDGTWLSSCQAMIHVKDRGFQDAIDVHYQVRAQIASRGRVHTFEGSGPLAPGQWLRKLPEGGWIPM